MENINNISKEDAKKILKEPSSILISKYTTQQLKQIINISKSNEISNDSNIILQKKQTLVTNNIPNISPPPISTQIKSLTKETINWVKNGMPVVSDKTYKNRLNICMHCEFWEKHENGPFDGRCLKCGCTSLKLKLSTTSCPIHKWSSVPTGQ